MGVLRQAPERAGNARKEQVEHEHEGNRLQHQRRGVPHDHRRRARRSAVQADEGRREQRRRGEQPETGGNALRFEVVRQQQEVAEGQQYRGIPPAAQFEQLHRHEENQQGDARLAPEQGAVLGEDRAAGRSDEQDKQPAAG